jgi:L-threonylcarbamoyladenylate synthase
VGAAVAATGTADERAAAVARAAALLAAGEVVALPTETVYGLAANALDAKAVERIFEAKGRPAHNPVIVHVSDVAMARRCSAAWPEPAERLAAAFWPGPLTLVLPRAPAIPDAVTAGGATVGLRWPRHPVAEAVIRACGFPLAAPSANRSGELSPTTAEHVRAALGDRIPLIVDGGPCAVGIESTVLDLAADEPRILRPGVVHAVAIASVIGSVAGASEPAPGEALRSPGLLERHYAPRARLLSFAWRDDAELERRVVAAGARRAETHVVAHTRLPAAGWASLRVLPRDAEAFARSLYAELHALDAAGAAAIVVEAPPSAPEWAGVADRLRRAAVPGSASS